VEIEELAIARETVRPKRMAGLLPDVLKAGAHHRVPQHLGDVIEDTDPD